MSIAPFVCTPIEVVHKMLLLAELKPGEVLYDLGSGDGRVVITAAYDFGVEAVGIELRSDLAFLSLEKVSKFRLENKVKIINDDLFNIKLNKADVITLYLTSFGNQKIEKKLRSELKLGARIISHDIELFGWKPCKKIFFKEGLLKNCKDLHFLKRVYYKIKNFYLPVHKIYLYKF